MNKTILAILVGAFLISGALYLTRPADYIYKAEEEVVSEEEASEEVVSEEEASEEVVSEEETSEEALENEEMKNLAECLAREGVVVYGSKTCPACAQLVASFGGYDMIAPIYIECTEEVALCEKEKETGYVPEIQIKGELYEGARSPENLASLVDCTL